MTNHKGKECPYKVILCQEGYCTECQIYTDYKNGTANSENKINGDKNAKLWKY